MPAGLNSEASRRAGGRDLDLDSGQWVAASVCERALRTRSLPERCAHLATQDRGPTHDGLANAVAANRDASASRPGDANSQPGREAGRKPQRGALPVCKLKGRRLVAGTVDGASTELVAAVGEPLVVDARDEPCANDTRLEDRPVARSLSAQLDVSRCQSGERFVDSDGHAQRIVRVLLFEAWARRVAVEPEPGDGGAAAVMVAGGVLERRAQRELSRPSDHDVLERGGVGRSTAATGTPVERAESPVGGGDRCVLPIGGVPADAEPVRRAPAITADHGDVARRCGRGVVHAQGVRPGGARLPGRVDRREGQAVETVGELADVDRERCVHTLEGREGGACRRSRSARRERCGRPTPCHRWRRRPCRRRHRDRRRRTRRTEDRGRSSTPIQAASRRSGWALPGDDGRSEPYVA